VTGKIGMKVGRASYALGKTVAFHQVDQSIDVDGDDNELGLGVDARA